MDTRVDTHPPEYFFMLKIRKGKKMFKRCIFGILILISGIFLRGNIIAVRADTHSDVTQVSSTYTITSGEEFSNKEYIVEGTLNPVFEISSDCVIENVKVILSSGSKINGAVFNVTKGSAIFKNVEIVSGGEISCARLMQVGTGAKAELVGFKSDVDTKYIARNYGTMVIRDFVYSGTSENGLQNNTKDFVLEKVTMDKIFLNKGASITVNENTRLDNNIQIVLPKSALFESGDTIVKGDSIFASYFFSKFSLTDNTGKKFVLEYFGATDGTNTNTGDIFLAEEKNKIVAYANATAVSYLTQNPKTVTYGGVVLDNYHAIATKNIMEKNISSSEEYVTLGVKNGESNENYYIGKNGSWLVFLDNYEETEATTSNNLTIQNIYTCKSHSAVLVTHQGNELQAELIVKDATVNTPNEPTTPNETEEPTEPKPTTPSKPEKVEVELEVGDKIFEYDGLDHFGEIKVWYVLNETTYYLPLEEKEVKDAGEYTLSVIFTSESENYELITFSTLAIEVEVKAKEITIEYTQTSLVYTGEEIIFSASAIELVDGDYCPITLSANKGTNAGEYVVDASIENPNYKIAESFTTHTFKILEAEISMQDIEIKVIQREYNGEAILLESYLTAGGLVRVKYTSQEELKNAKKYDVNVEYELLDSNHILPANLPKTTQINIATKKIVPHLKVSEFVYTGKVPELEIYFTGTLKDDEIKYTLNQDKNVNVLSAGYVVQVILNESNYIIESGKECLSYNIVKATIDEKNISFEDIRKEYDGKQVLLKDESICNGLILAKYVNLDKEIVNSGTYIVTISLFLTDKINYSPLTKTEYSIKVVIEKREIEPILSNNEFEYSGLIPDITFSFKNVLNEDEINYNITMDKNTCVGEYVVEVILDEKDNITSNYFISSLNSKHTYKISKKVVDIRMVKFEDKEIMYGEEVVIVAENLPDGIRVKYSNIQDFVVGEYKIIANFELEDTWNYILTQTSLCMTLTVKPKEVDISKLKLQDKRFIYDGESHSLNEEDITLEGVKFSPVGERVYRDAGEYKIMYELAPLNSNYKLVGKNDVHISGVLKITQADYNISNIIFSDTTIPYDTLPHTITYTGTLPEGLSVLETDTYVDAGSYNISLTFVNTNPNYFTPKPKTAVLKISKKEVSIQLQKSVFTYTGTAVKLACDVMGVLGEDKVEATLDYLDSIHAGDYVANVLSLSNANYISTTKTLDYVINKAPSDVSGLSFKDVEFTYNGEVYTPDISGTMPSYLTYEIFCEKEIKNAGVYDVYTKFTADRNHITPKDLHAKVIIHKKEVTVVFSKYLDLKYTGRTQYIDVDIKGMLDAEQISVWYNETPQEAGTYTCKVTLNEASNYVITGNDTCIFNIYLEKKISQNDEYTVSIEGALFDTTSDLTLNTLSLSLVAKETLKNKCENLDSYECFEICSETKTDDVTYELSINSLNLSKGNYTLYQLLNTGEITEVSYTLKDNTITFTAPTNSTFILAKSKTPSALPIYLILLSSLLAITITTTLIFLHKKRKKQ